MGIMIMSLILNLLLMLMCAFQSLAQQTTTRLDVVYDGATAGKIRGFEQGVPKANYIDLVWPSSLAANYTLTMPKTTATLLAEINYHYHDSQSLSWSAWRARGTEASPTDLSSGDGIVQLTSIARAGGTWVAVAGLGMGYLNSGSDAGYVDIWTRNATSYGPRINFSPDGHIYPYGVGTQDIGASSVRWRKGWFVDLDISGTCTGCGGGGTPPITWTLETNDDILTMQHHLAAGTVARNILTQYSRGTNASPSAAGAGDSIFTEKWQYYAGGAYRDAGAIFVNVPSGVTTSSTNSPAHIAVFATNHGATSGTEVVRFGAQTFGETPSFGARWFSGMWPSTSATYDLGAYGVEWLTLWASRIRTSTTNNIDFYPGNAQRWSMGYVNGTLTPTVDTGPSIGSQTSRVHSVWATQHNTYTHNSWGAQTNQWAADNVLTHRLSTYGASYYPATEYRHARGTEASPTVVSNGDTLMFQLFDGYNGSSYTFSAYTQVIVDGTPSGTTVPGAIYFGTMNSSGTLAVRLRIRASGDIEIPGNLIVSGTCTGCGSGGTPPIDWYLDSGSTVLTLGNHGTVTGNQIYTKFSRGTQASPSDAAIGDTVMRQIYQYYAGSAYRDTAAITVTIPTVSASVSGSSSPSTLAIYATDRATTTNTKMIEFGAHAAGFGVMTNSNIQSSGNGTHDLGASGYEWFQIWTSKWKSASTLEMHSGGAQRWVVGSSTGSLVPSTDGGPTIGNVSYKPSEVWARIFGTYTSSSYGTQSNNFTADANLNLFLNIFSSTAADRPALQMYRARGSYASPSTVSDNDSLGNVAWFGYYSSTFYPAAVIRSNVDGTPGASFVPGEILFQTTDAFGTLNTNLTIMASGDLTVRTWVNSPAFNATTAFYFSGTAGLSSTISVRKGDDSAACNLVVQGGIITSTTC